VAGPQTLNLQNFDNIETKGNSLIGTLALIFGLEGRTMSVRWSFEREEDRGSLHDSFL
jgi:hypothetical protein